MIANQKRAALHKLETFKEEIEWLKVKSEKGILVSYPEIFIICKTLSWQY